MSGGSLTQLISMFLELMQDNSIVRRSTVALEQDVLDRNGLKQDDQERLSSGNPYDERYWTINIPRDKFNGDPLNGNGPSGWNIKPDQVTMYKIEFGWYGAIGARFLCIYSLR